jgi:hypothetical protein
MPKRKKTATKQKQKQSQRQSVVVNIGASKAKSKPRKSSGRGGLPPPSYQHNLAPTFVTAPQVDYAPIIGAIAGLTAKLSQEPRIQNPITPLSSSVQATQTMTQGEQTEERRAGRTAGNFQEPPSQVRAKVELPVGAPLPRPLSSKKKTNELPEPILGSRVKGRRRDAQMELSYIAEQQKALQQQQASQRRSLGEELKGVVNPLRGPAEEPSSKQKTGLEQAQEAITMVKEAQQPTKTKRQQRAEIQAKEDSERLARINVIAKEEGMKGLNADDIAFIQARPARTTRLRRLLKI